MTKNFSAIPVVNQLTALLVGHGVRHAVLCPGSRNAPICHNINEVGSISVHPVTDERSAGFFAIGLSQATALEHVRPQPVAVCVTSGSAILDLAPAVAEAFYQRIPLIVIAADRPEAWIGQLDGQTLPQPNAFGSMVRKSVQLPMGNGAQEQWHANRLINEALLEATALSQGPVLINVPLAEPLYEFGTGALPVERVCRRPLSKGLEFADVLAERLAKAERPMLVIGHLVAGAPAIAHASHAVAKLARLMPVVCERLSGLEGIDPTAAMTAMNASSCEEYKPDTIIYIGETIVSKEFKAFLRSCDSAETVVIAPDGALYDTFLNTAMVLQAEPLALLCRLADDPNLCHSADSNFVSRWNALTVNPLLVKLPARLTHQQAVRAVALLRGKFHIQAANSSTVRLCNAQMSAGRIWCNRGVNGIDGSVSTAVGFAIGAAEPTLLITGDLGFFYDSNAFWNCDMRHSPHARCLAVLLVNNGGGGIFSRFKGLAHSAAKDSVVMACHETSAEGLCAQHDVEYRACNDIADLDETVDWLTQFPNDGRPRLLEIFTDMAQDADDVRLFNDALKSIVNN